jgi:hypothetical protein
VCTKRPCLSYKILHTINIAKYDILITKLSNIILDNNYSEGFIILSDLKTKILNFLIAQILDNSPEVDIFETKFNNIITELYPYQINNLNWMLNIENKNYTEEFNDIKNNS